MSKTKKQLPQRSTLGVAIFALASRDRDSLRRRVTKTVVTSDSAGGLCDHPTQPGLEDCGWGVRLETLTLRQNDGAWEIVLHYLEANEEVLAVLRDWSDLDTLPNDLDCRLASEIRAKEDARTQRIYEALKSNTPQAAAYGPVSSSAPCVWDDEDEDDDDSFWG